MPAYVIAKIRVDDAETYEEYRRMVPAVIESFGGRYLARGGRHETVEGDASPGRVVVLEFPSYEDARRWYDSPEYGVAKEIRQRCSVGEVLIVEGV